MATKVDFYCWARCHTCRKAKEFLLQKNAELNDRDFFKKPFSQTEIKDLLQGRPASDMFNFKSPSFKQLGLVREKLNDNELIDLMVKEPRLIRRPIIRIGGKVYFREDMPLVENLIA
jgi:Spx/MgsR family transcriptional regulator